MLTGARVLQVVDSLTSIYGPQDARTATALHNLAGAKSRSAAEMSLHEFPLSALNA